MARKKGTELSVFKGREAKLNRAIFQALALKGPQTIYGIYKHVRTQLGLKYIKYASVNKRVKVLEASGYAERTGLKRTKAGFDVAIFELTARACLAIVLDSMGPQSLIERANEGASLSILAAIFGNE